MYYIPMTIYLSFVFFIFGAIIGSFLNVVLYRFNTGKGLGGRSKCSSCKRTLDARDLFPIVSWIVLRGKCRTCESKISPQYIIVEIFTAILFLFVYLKNAPILDSSPLIFAVSTAISLVIMSLLVLITVYDLKHKIIPDEFSYSFAAIAFLQIFLNFNYETSSIYLGIPLSNGFIGYEAVMMLLSGIFVAFPFYFLWLISSGRWMGLGDAKLALGIGWLLGIKYGFSAIVFAFWIGAVISLIVMGGISLMKYVSKKTGGRGFGPLKNLYSVKFQSEIPFAPFLIIGLLIVFFLNISVMDFLAIFTA
jgi:prepilin signal peptidase PulO-like enzyme (type II secretory pathway)